jgi:Uma2 family endonuclease
MIAVAVHLDPALPVRALTVAQLDAMVQASIVGEDDRVELIDGMLVEMSPQTESHAYAVRELTALAAPVADAAGLRMLVQSPLDVGSAVSRPEPDLAIVPRTPRDRHPTDALLVVEVAVSSQHVDLGRKAQVYAGAGIPEYWVLDVSERELVVHRTPRGERYESVRRLTPGEVAAASAVALSVPVDALL